MSNTICFFYTETNGLHKSTEPITKKKLYNYARLVSLHYIIGHYNEKKKNFVINKEVYHIVNPRTMYINEESIKYNNIDITIAKEKGKDIDYILNEFKKDLENVDILISHNVDFHLKTILNEILRYNVIIEFNNFLIIDTSSFYHENKYIKLFVLAENLNIEKYKDKKKVEIIMLIFFKLYKNFKKSII